MLPDAAAQGTLALYGYRVNPLKVHSPAAAPGQSRPQTQEDWEREETRGSEEGSRSVQRGMQTQVKQGRSELQREPYARCSAVVGGPNESILN